MKRQLLLIATLLAFISVYAVHVVPVRTMVIPYASGVSMVMDAADDEVSYSPVQSMDAFNPLGSTGADADFTSTFRVCYNLQYLYFYGKILDDYNNGFTWGSANQWTYDNWELFMDLDTNGSGNSPAYDTNTIQIRFNRNVDSVNDPGRAPRSAYIYSHDSELPDGWAVEVAIPWKFVLGSGQLPEEIAQYMCATGFDVSAADSDTDGADARDCQTAWDNDEPQTQDDRTEDNAWNNRTVFGVVTFSSHYGSNCFNAIEPLNEPVSKINLFPNPARNAITLNNTQQFSSLEIFNLLGQNVITGVDVLSGKNEIDISELPAGNMYFVRIKDQNGLISTGKFVKE